MTIWAALLLATGCAQLPHARAPNDSLAPLEHLRSEINAAYGFRDRVPRVNLGPCGRFARDFRTEWNKRFADPVVIAFVMAADNIECYHVLVRLPDGRYFDGGNGVITGEQLTSLWAGSHLEEMPVFNSDILDKRSYSLRRDYPVCPNYSDAFTRQVIRTNLDRLAKQSLWVNPRR